MSQMKPIQATPELKGEDAMKALKQAYKSPTPEAIELNEMLLKDLEEILKR